MTGKYDINLLIQNFKEGDKIALARLITVIENEPEKAGEIFKNFQDLKNESYIIGITGSPGVGKSTLTKAITKQLLERGKKIGIISVDPTSPFTGGAFLGDRVRMTEVSLDPNVFIRSLASRGYRGGISRAVLDISLLYEAFGIDFIIIETVGVGQSEFEIYNLAYTVVVVMVPGYGDAIQMQKAGIIEIGDVYDVNKKDLGGEDVAAHIDMMLDDSCATQGGWRPPIAMTNSITGEGVDELVEYILDHKEHLELSELVKERKKNRFAYKIRELLYYRIDKILESLINEEEINKLSSSVIQDGKFKIYDEVHDIFSNVKFEMKKKNID
ncbi:MAG: methylmalonyl Co-A mutase-associated GTPase MeaB [Candidatus Hermodarchaeota archaeon]